MKKSKTTVINLFGGPGSGKSTLASLIYAKAKEQQKDIELVQEWIKTWAWQKRIPKAFETPIIFANQFKVESDLYNLVPVLVTDSPWLLSAYYAQDTYFDMYLRELRRELISKQGIIFKDYFVQRGKRPYKITGRYQSKSEAEAIDRALPMWLPGIEVTDLQLVTPDDSGRDFILKEIYGRN